MFKVLVKNLRILYKGIFNYSYFNSLNKGVPIVVGGCGRSGTTLFLSIIAAHPDVHGISRETGTLRKESLNVFPRFWTMLRLSADTLIDKKTSATRWMEKTPRNINNIDGINRFFNGKVKFVHIVRDGRDVILSRHPTDKNNYWLETDRWVNDVSNGLKYSDLNNMYLVKYEDLINNFDQTVKDLLDFLDLDFAPEVIDYYQHTSVSKNVAWESGVQKIYTGSINKWQKPEYKERVSKFMLDERAKALMKKLGYIEA